MAMPDKISETFGRNPKTKPSKLQRDIVVNSL